MRPEDTELASGEAQRSSSRNWRDDLIERVKHIGVKCGVLDPTIGEICHEIRNAPVLERGAWQPGEPRVVCAALKDANGRIVTGARHFDSVMMEQIKRGPAVDDWRGADQGFIDQKGNYLTREEAHVIASANKQILRRVGSDECSLFSENLY